MVIEKDAIHDGEDSDEGLRNSSDLGFGALEKKKKSTSSVRGGYYLLVIMAL